MQPVGQVVVGQVCRGSPMPRRPVRVDVTQRPCESLVCAAAFEARGCLVDRRAHQRVFDHDHVTRDRQQTGIFGPAPCGGLDPELARGLPDGAGSSGVVRGRYQQQCLRSLAQPAATVEEGALQAGGQRELLRHCRIPVELGRAETGRQLEQCQRVPAAVANQPLGDLARHRLPAALVQKLTGGPVVKTTELEHRQVMRLERAAHGGAGGEHHHHWVGIELTRREQQRVG